MQTYHLRHIEELNEELRLLGIKVAKLEQEYLLAIGDINADVAVIKAEMDLLDSLGKL